MTDKKTERRKHKRADLRVKAEYEVLRFVPQVLRAKEQVFKHTAETANISEGGLQLLDDKAPEPGQVLRIVFNPGEEERIKAFAKVKWAGYDNDIKKFRIGMEFYYLHDCDKKRIQALVN